MWISHCLARCLLEGFLFMFSSCYRILYPMSQWLSSRVQVMVMLQPHTVLRTHFFTMVISKGFEL